MIMVGMTLTQGNMKIGMAKGHFCEIILVFKTDIENLTLRYISTYIGMDPTIISDKITPSDRLSMSMTKRLEENS